MGWWWWWWWWTGGGRSFLQEGVRVWAKSALTQRKPSQRAKKEREEARDRQKEGDSAENKGALSRFLSNSLLCWHHQSETLFHKSWGNSRVTAISFRLREPPSGLHAHSFHVLISDAAREWDNGGPLCPNRSLTLLSTTVVLFSLKITRAGANFPSPLVRHYWLKDYN